MVHLIGWAFFTLLAFLQDPGRTAADTKLDLALDPAGFLSQATSAYTDEFTLGQIQNQAYGYLFPQGLFFLLTEPLPDWVAQRLWWALLMGLAFSGTYLLARKMGITRAVVPAVLYALSPRILTTLTAISSEAWPVALVPWVLLPLVGAKVTWRHAAEAVIPVALMGAVNATATLMACIPAGILLLWRKQFAALGIWLAGCAAVSAWWIGPLLVLGRYSPPFTDYIESAFTTTYWLNLAEIFRGTTSWAPFVETERVAGHLLVSEPVFVLATMAIAAIGFAGLASRSMPWRGYLVATLCVGVALMGMGHGPLSQLWTSLLDDPLAPFRNLHKLDPLVRLPLVLGVGHVISQMQWKRVPVLTAVGLIALTATAPAWSLRMAPEGTWAEVPQYWHEAAEFVDKHAADTRTLVLPETSFARQEWGWTRDEPIQALADVPFAVRDAIPLIDSEAIRGLDGVLAGLDAAETEEDASEVLRSIGVGSVLVRHDLDTGAEEADADEEQESLDLPGEKHTFGEIDIYLLEPERDMMISADAPVRVAGGGESIGLLNARYGYAPRELVTEDAEIVTDTPALAVRNYGTLDGAVSAHLRDLGEGSDVNNRVPDYQSQGERVGVVEEGGSARASSSAADASSFGGASPSRSLTAAFDGDSSTAWWPQPGDEGWIESTVSGGEVTIVATQNTRVRVISDSFDQEVSLSSYSPRTIRVPGEEVRIELTEPAGIAELETGVSRLVTVPDTSPNAQVFMFQRLMPETTTLQRGFTTHQDDTWELSASATIDGEDYPAGPVELPAGEHVLETEAEVITLERGEPSAQWVPFNGTVPASDSDQTVVTTRAFNEGMRMSVGGTEIPATRIDAGQTAFVVPADVSGEVEFSFAGQRPYQLSLLLGGALGIVALIACTVVAFTLRRQPPETAPYIPQNNNSLIAPLAAVALVGGLPGIAAAAVVWAIRRYTLIPAWALAGASTTFMGLWLARAPWPTEGYAGDSILVTFAGCAVLACLALRNQRIAGRSTNS